MSRRLTTALMLIPPPPFDDETCVVSASGKTLNAFDVDRARSRNVSLRRAMRWAIPILRSEWHEEEADALEAALQSAQSPES